MRMTVCPRLYPELESAMQVTKTNPTLSSANRSGELDPYTPKPFGRLRSSRTPLEKNQVAAPGRKRQIRRTEAPRRAHLATKINGPGRGHHDLTTAVHRKYQMCKGSIDLREQKVER